MKQQLGAKYRPMLITNLLLENVFDFPPEKFLGRNCFDNLRRQTNIQ